MDARSPIRHARSAIVPGLVLAVLALLMSSSTVAPGVQAATGIVRNFTSGDHNVTLNFTREALNTDYSLKIPKESNVLSAKVRFTGEYVLKTNQNKTLNAANDWRQGAVSPESTIIYDSDGLHLDMDNLAPFEAEKNKAAGSNVRSSAAGDFNKDGRMDLVVTNLDADTVSVFTQNANKDLVKGTDIATSSGPVSVETGDLNSDGRTDFAVACDDGQCIDVFLSKSTGGFTKKTISHGANLKDIDIADLTGDSRDDIALVAGTENGVIYRQNSDGNFTNIFDTSVTGGGYYWYNWDVRAVACGDFNRDGRNDVVWTVGYNYPYNYEYTYFGAIKIHFQSTSGTFSSSYNYLYYTSADTRGVDAGDVTGDGRDDIVVTTYYSNKVKAFYQVASGGFSGPTVISGITNPTWPRIADYDGDGLNDVCIGGNGKKFAFAKQKDGELVTSAKTWDSNQPIYDVAAGDFNGDGLNDAVTANTVGNNIGIWIQRRDYSGTWVTKPAITQPLLIRYINFTLGIDRRGGDTKAYFSTDSGLNWTQIANRTTYDLVNRTMSVWLKITTYSSSAAKYDRVKSIGMNMTYQTYPADLVLDLGDDKSTEWSHPGELMDGADVTDLAPSLTAYVQNYTHQADAAGFVTIPVGIYSATPGRLYVTDLDILFNNASRPPQLLTPSDNGWVNATPTFTFYSNDTDDDLLLYKLQISKSDFSSTFDTVTFDMTRSLFQEKEGEGFRAATFRQGYVATFRLPDSYRLDDDTVYKWRAYAFDMYLWSRSSRVFTMKVDSITPIGHASSPKYATALDFTVTWSAEDVVPGSGLAPDSAYDVQYRRSTETSWTDWQARTTDTSAIFRGEEGLLYYFRMRARDAVMNEQLYIGGKGDTQTMIDTVAPTVTWTQMPNFQDTRSFLVKWVPTDFTPGSGIRYYEVQVSKEQGEWTKWLSEFKSTQSVYSADADTVYAFRCRALDSAGNQGPWSDVFDVRIDATPPVLMLPPRVPLKGGVWEQLDRLLVGFNYVDLESGVRSIEVGIGTDRGLFDVLAPTALEYPASGQLELTHLDLVNSAQYFVGVHAENNAGAWTDWAWSDEFTVAIPGPKSTVSYPMGTVTDPRALVKVNITDPRGYNITLGDLRMRYATRIGDQWPWSDWERVSNARTDVWFDGKRGFRYQFMYRAQNELGSWGPFYVPVESEWFFVNNPPVANGGPAKVVRVGRDVQFSAEESSDRDGDNLTYRWDFGDGARGDGLFVAHKFARSGLYTVTLTVSDGHEGSVARTTVYAEAQEKAPGFGSSLAVLGLVAAAVVAALASAGRRNR